MQQTRKRVAATEQIRGGNAAAEGSSVHVADAPM